MTNSMDKWKDRLSKFYSTVFKSVDHRFYPMTLFWLAFVDMFIIIIPTDSLLIGSALINPKKWLRYSIGVTLGSSIAAVIVAIGIKHFGQEFINTYLFEAKDAYWWNTYKGWVETYGPAVLWFIMASPLLQQPCLILVSLSDTTLLNIALIIFSARAVKFCLFGYVSAKSPKLLEKTKYGRDLLAECRNMIGNKHVPERAWPE